MRRPLLVPDLAQEIAAVLQKMLVRGEDFERDGAVVPAFLQGAHGSVNVHRARPERQVQVGMKKAALVRIDCELFGREPRGTLEWMLTPGVS